MSVERIAGRYAKSLLDLSIEKGKVEEVLQDMKGIKELVKNRDLFLLLKSPIIKSDAKERVISKIFDGKVSDLTSKFLSLIIKKGREVYLPEISAEFENQYKALQGISDITLITANAVGDDFVKGIEEKLLASNQTGSALNISSKVDPSLIGGYIIKIGDKLLDFSVKSKLDSIKKQFATA